MTLLRALILVIIIATTMNHSIDRPRPFDSSMVTDPLYRPTDPSFPSEHTMAAFVAAAVIGSKWKKALGPLLLLAAAIGFSRVHIGIHYPLDVIAGALIGIEIALIAMAIGP